MNKQVETITMYRPTGKNELQLVIDSGYKKWPARLPMQPIFYPVTNEQYAIEVNNWNVKEKGIGYVTRFEVNKSFVDRYKIETVGGSNHTATRSQQPTRPCRPVVLLLALALTLALGLVVTTSKVRVVHELKLLCEGTIIRDNV